MESGLPIHRVLMIAYYFPPLGLSGVQRTLKFAKYLPDFGWHPTVLTVEDRGYFAKDPSLLVELEGRPVSIHRTPSFDPLHVMRRRDVLRMPSAGTLSLLGKLSQCVFIPDNKIGWKRRAVREGLRIIAEQDIHAIFATAPPYTDFLIGMELKRRTGLPLIVDYRDSWLDNPLHFYLTPLHKAVHAHLERGVLERANGIVTINRPIKEQILRRYDTVAHHDVTIIPQGYDQQDFVGVKRGRGRDGKLRIVYSGTLYFNRHPGFLLRAMKLLFEQHPETRNKVELHIVGTPRTVDQALARELGLEGSVHFPGYLPHAQAVQALVDADVLWLMIGRGTGEEMMSTGKLYEYLGAGKPILGTVPEGAARQVLEKSGAAFLAPPDDVPAIEAQLRTLFSLFKNDRLPRPSFDYVSQFDRKTLTGQLAQLLLTHVHGDGGEASIHTRPGRRRTEDEPHPTSSGMQ